MAKRRPSAPVTGGEAFSLADLGAVVKDAYPDQFADVDDLLELGQIVTDVHPELRPLVDPRATAAALGVDVSPRVGMAPSGARDVPAGVAREVVARTEGGRRAREGARGLERFDLARQSAVPLPEDPGGAFSRGLIKAASTERQAKRGAIRAFGGMTRGALRTAELAADVPRWIAGEPPAVTLGPTASPRWEQTARRAVQRGEDALLRQMDRAYGAPTPEPQTWSAPWWGQQTGSVAASVLGLGLAGTARAAAIAEALVEAGDVLNDLDAQVAAGTLSKDEANLRGVTTALANYAVLRGTNIPLFEPIGGKLRQLFTGGGVEALQEGSQQIFSNLATGRPWDEGLAESIATGGMAGTGFVALRQRGAAPFFPKTRQKVRESLMGRPLGDVFGDAIRTAVPAAMDPGAAAQAARGAEASARTPEAQAQAVTTPPTAEEMAAAGVVSTTSQLRTEAVDEVETAAGPVFARRARRLGLREPSAPAQGDLPGVAEPGLFGQPGELGGGPVPDAAQLDQRDEALRAGRVITARSPSGSPLFAEDIETPATARTFRPSAATPAYVPPTTRVTLAHLSGRERGTLRRVRDEIEGALAQLDEIEASGDRVALAEARRAIAEVLPPALAQLAGLERHRVPPTAEETVEALTALLDEDTPSALSDTAVAAVRDWLAGRDLPEFGTAVVEPSWAEEMAAAEQELAMARPGEVFSRADRLGFLEGRLRERHERLRLPESAEVTVHVPTVRGRTVRQRVRLTGQRLAEYRQVAREVKDAAIPLWEERAVLRRAAGVLTPEERAAETPEAQDAQEGSVPTARRRRTARERLAVERASRLARIGENRPLEALQARAQRELDLDPDVNPHLRVLQAIEDLGGLHLPPTDRTAAGRRARQAYGGGRAGGAGEADWFGEFAAAGQRGGRVAGRQVFRRLTTDQWRELRRVGGVRNLEEVAHQLTQEGGPFEGWSLDEFSEAFQDALTWARDHWGELMPGRKRTRRGPAQGTLAGVAPAEAAEAAEVETAAESEAAETSRAYDPPRDPSLPDTFVEPGTESASPIDPLAPDPSAPIGSPARTAYHRAQVRRVLTRYLSEVGSLNLEHAPELLREVVSYGASLLVERGGRAAKNFVAWSAAMRQRFRWLHQQQLSGIWRALKAANGRVDRAVASLSPPTTRTELQRMATRTGQTGWAGSLGQIEQERFTAHLSGILDLVDWSRIVRVAGTSRTDLRVFRQIAEQILSREVFDPVAESIGLTSRADLARYFTRSLTLAGRTLGLVGNATQANWQAITHIEAQMLAGEANLAKLLPDVPRVVASIPDGRIVWRGNRPTVEVGGHVFDVAELRRAGEAFERVLDDLVLSAADEPMAGDRSPGWLTRIATGSDLGSNLGALFQALQQAAIAEVAWAGQDPQVARLAAGTGPWTEHTLAQALRREAPSLASDAVQVQTAFMLFQPKTAIRNAIVQGFVLPMAAFSHAVAALTARAAQAAGASLAVTRDAAGEFGLTLAGSSAIVQQAREDAARKHTRYTTELARALVRTPGMMLRLTPWVGGKPWGQSLDEIYQLQESVAAAGGNPRDVVSALYLLRDIPGVAAEYLGYAGSVEERDVQQGHRAITRLAAKLQTLTRWQEYAFRATIFNGVVQAEFARRGVDYARFLAEIVEAQGRAARDLAFAEANLASGAVTAEQVEEQRQRSLSTLQTDVLSRYFPNVDEYVQLMQTAMAQSLNLTFAGRGLPGGLQEWWMSLFNAKGFGTLFRFVRPFPRFVMNAAMWSYDRSLAALIELPLYAGTTLTAHLGQRVRGKSPTDPGGKGRGRLARAFESRMLDAVAVPNALRSAEDARTALEAATLELGRLKRIAREDVKAQAQAGVEQLKALDAYATMLRQRARSKARRGASGAGSLLGTPPPAFQAPASSVPPAPRVRIEDIQQQEAIRAVATKALRELRQQAATLRRRQLTLEVGGAGDQYLYVGKIATGAAMLSLAMVMRGMLPDRDEVPWWQWTIPSWLLRAKPEDEAVGGVPTLDTRGDQPLAQYALFADLILDLLDDEKLDWDQVRADHARLNRERPGRTSWTNWIEAFRTNYTGKYTAERLRSDLIDATVQITREGQAQSFIADIIFGQGPRGSTDPGQITDTLLALAGAVASRYTIPFRTALELQAAFDPEAAKQRWTERGHAEDVPWWQGPMGQPFENLPWIRELIPTRENPYTGREREMAFPGLALLGRQITVRTDLEREFERLGITAQQVAIRPTRIPEVDNAILKEYGQLLDLVARPITQTAWYQAQPRVIRRQVLIGVEGAGTRGERLTVGGLLPELKTAAVGIALGRSPELWEAYQRAHPTMRQSVDFEQFFRALMGSAEWIRARYGVDLLETPGAGGGGRASGDAGARWFDDDEAGEGSGAGTPTPLALPGGLPGGIGGSLAGVPPPGPS